MIEATTQKTKKKNQKKGKKKEASGGLTCGCGHGVAESAPSAEPSAALNIQLAAATTDQGVGGDEKGGCGNELDEGSVLTDTTKLTDLEKNMNNNKELHPAGETIDTRVHLCRVCNRRMLKFANFENLP